jgi:choline dehydrogenase
MKLAGLALLLSLVGTWDAALADQILEADFVVIGSGPAGSIVAGRLAQSSARPSVILLEAGELTGDQSAFVIPYDWGTICNFHQQPGCSWEWDIVSETENINDGSQSLWLGKQTGGNGKNNAMLYIRGAKADFDDIAKLGDDFSHWAPDSVASYFKILEDASQQLQAAQEESSGIDIGEILNEEVGVIGPDGLPISALDVYQEYGENVTYGVDGAMSVTENLYVEEDMYENMYIPSWEALGLHTHEEMNGPGNALGGLNGLAYTRFDIDPTNGTRDDPFEAFVRPLIKNPPAGYNFTLITGAEVTTLTMEDDGQGNHTVVAVNFVKDGQNMSVSVLKEAIVSAGVIFSPKILLQSGIGAREHLEAVGVPVIIDLTGVGDGVKDHVTVPQFFTFNEGGYVPRYSNPTPEDMILYESSPSSGPYASSGPQLMSFFRVDEEGTQSYAGGEVIPDGPNMQITISPKSGWMPAGNSQKPGFQHMLTLTEPRSNGTIRLQSNDPLDPPAVHIGYLEDPVDMQMLWQGFQLARKVLQQDALASQGQESFPGDSVSNYDEFENYVRYGNGFIAVNHYTGGCTLGKVVDENLKVYNTSNLRVADGSVADQISVNTQATIMMFGSFLSEHLLELHYPNATSSDLPL